MGKVKKTTRLRKAAESFLKREKSGTETPKQAAPGIGGVSANDFVVDDVEETSRSKAALRKSKKRKAMLLRQQEIGKEIKAEERSTGIDGFGKLDLLLEKIDASIADRSKKPQKSEKPKTKSMSSKARRRATAAEAANLVAVSQHPQFKEDPFEVMYLHLKNTVGK